MTETATQRPIRSFIRRQGRITGAQRQALDTLWDHYCLTGDAEFEWDHAFPRSAPVILEIGFGNGDSLAATAASHPENNYLGIEVHRPGVGHLMLALHRGQLENVRIFCADAIEILTRAIPDASLHGINLFFPDPWHKKRHHKRRIVSPAFVDLVCRKLLEGGRLHCATDWEDYAQQMLTIIEADSRLQNTAGAGQYAARPASRPQTKFETRGLRLGHPIHDLIFERLP